MDELIDKVNNRLNNWEQTGQKLGGIRRTKVLELWYSDQLGSVLIGNKRFSTDRQIADYIARLEGAA